MDETMLAATYRPGILLPFVLEPADHSVKSTGLEVTTSQQSGFGCEVVAIMTLALWVSALLSGTLPILQYRPALVLVGLEVCQQKMLPYEGMLQFSVLRKYFWSIAFRSCWLVKGGVRFHIPSSILATPKGLNLKVRWAAPLSAMLV